MYPAGIVGCFGRAGPAYPSVTDPNWAPHPSRRPLAMGNRLLPGDHVPQKVQNDRHRVKAMS
jgi:hypothetical protein